MDEFPRPNLLSLIQNAAATMENMSALENDESPSDSITLLIDRQILSPSELADLRCACIALACNIKPHGHDQSDSRNRLESRKKNKDDKTSAKQPSHTRASKSESQPRSSCRQDPEQITDSVPYIQVPVNATPGPKATPDRKRLMRDANTVNRLVEATRSTSSESKSRNQRDSGNQVPRSSTNVPTRLFTSTGAFVDHRGLSIDTSNSTSRTGTTAGQPASTALSSLASPANEKKSSPGSNRVSKQLPDESEVAARAWMEDASQRARLASERASRPRSRASWSHHKSHGTDRPVSRAGVIAESFKESVRSYIRPRPSSDTMRFTRSETNLSTGNGRDGDDNGGSNWWRSSGLGSKRSWSSFRNARPEDEDPHSVGKDGWPNLNRELPALPGLDQYRERKPSTTHIAQLMRPERAAKKSTELSRPRPGSDPINHQALIEAERIRHEKAVQQAMEDRLRHHTRMASATFGLYARQKAHAARNRANTTTMPPLASTAGDAPRAPVESSRKEGLRSRLSRFLHHRGKGVNGGSKKYGQVVTVN